MTSPTRSVVVRLSMDPSSYIAGAAKAEASTLSLDRAASKVGPSTATSMDRAARGTGLLDSSMRRMLPTMAVVAAGVAGIATAVSTIKLGVAYEDSLTQVQAVTGATAAQMAAVRAETKALGADLSLPATSAADAALALNSLAKGGLSVEQAMAAAKGTLQLAAAAQIDGATAADIQAAALNTFGLSADQAGRVADVLANTANMSAGSITDFAWGMQQAGNVASMFGLSVEDTAAALGIFANNGIKGSDAGTSLKTMLTALTDQGKPAQAAIADLGLTIYDQQGKFVGLAELADQLAAASKRMSAEQFQAAAATLFGTDAIRAASVFARTGAAEFNAFADGVSRAGGAAKLSESYMKGLGGAWRGFVSTVQDVQLDLFAKMAPGLEKLVRAATANLPQVIDWLRRVRDQGVAAFGAVADYLSPITSRLDDLWASITRGDGMLASLWDLFKVGAGAVGGLLQAARPLVGLVGGLLGLFSKLPGPVQAAIAVLTAMKMLNSGGGIFGFLRRDVGDATAAIGGGAGRGGLTGALRTAGTSVVGFGQTVRTNMSLASAEVGVTQRAIGGFAVGAQTYFPRASAAAVSMATTTKTAMAEMSLAFAQAKIAQQSLIATRFGLPGLSAVPKATGDIAGLGAAAGVAARTGLGAMRTAASGLMGVLGGPWGVALAGATIGIGLITSAVQAHDRQLVQTKSNLVGYMQAMGQGGTAAVDAKAKLDSYKQQVADTEAQLKSLQSVQISGVAASSGAGAEVNATKKQLKELKDSLADATSEYAKQQAALSPVEFAQQKVTAAQNNLNVAIRQYGAESPKAVAAANSLRNAQANLGVVTEQTNAAALGAVGAWQQRNNAILAGAQASLAAQQAQSSLDSTVQTYIETMGSASATDLQKKQASEAVAAAALNTAQALATQAKVQSTATTEEGKQRDADAALLASLKATAQQMGVDTPQSITDLIGSLQNSMDTANSTARAMTGLGIEVTNIPDEKSVVIDAPTAEQQARLEALGYTVQTLPDGQVKVTADTSSALTGLNSLYRFIDANRNQIITTTVRGSGTSGSGGRTIRQAAGGIVHAYADGGIEPMRAGIAQVVPPRTYRLIGDRVTDDEAYIPINGSARSKQILAVTAGRMGFGLTTGEQTAPLRTRELAGVGGRGGGDRIDYDRLAAAIRGADGDRALVSIGQWVSESGQTPYENAEALAFLSRTRKS